MRFFKSLVRSFLVMLAFAFLIFCLKQIMFSEYAFYYGFGLFTLAIAICDYVCGE